MKFLLIVFFIIFSMFNDRLVAFNFAKMCCVRDNECLRKSIDGMFVILRKMNKTVSPDSVVVEKDFTENFDLDIASGTATFHKCEISNILSAQIINLRSRVNDDNLYLIIDFLVPSINAVAYGETHMQPKIMNIGPLQGISIPTKIETKGKIKTTFRNVSLSLAFQFKMIDKIGNKKSLVTEHMDGKLDCGQRFDEKFTYIPDPGFKSRISKIFMEVVLNARSQQICQMLMEKEEQRDFLEGVFKNRIMRHFGKVRFLNC